MKEKKIVAALSALNVYELNSFKKFVQSPYFNVNQNIVLYLDLLEGQLRKKEKEPELSDQKYWEIIFKPLPYNELKFNKLNSDLVKLFEQFIAQQEFDKMPSFNINLKLEGLRKKNIDKLYNGVIGEVQRLEKIELNKSADYYLHKYLIEKTLFNLTNENEKKTSKTEILRELNIPAISRNLDYFYVAEKLKYYCTLLSWQKMYNLDIQMDHMDFVFSLSETENFQKIPPIAIYSKIHDTFIEREKEEHYIKLKELISQHIHLFPPTEMREIYYTAISYCIEQVNKGNLKFHIETYIIYKEALDSNVLLVDNALSPSDFRNIVAAALRVSEYDWVEYFIHDYAIYLEEKSRNNAVHFNMARLDFYRKNYRKVIEHLQKVNYEDVWYNLGSKTLLISSYYELDEFDALESLLQAFRMYIDREKSLTKDRKTAYLNLIKYTKSLIRISPKDKVKIQILKESINDEKTVAVKPWLLEKIAELEK
ncbi:MAG: hypothetical protein IPM42_01590 [Saprospiraceae bacterium]|nr:hypothetical protein [Saprospiraceae bacterium]